MKQYYIIRYKNHGLPKGKLGDMLLEVYQLKLNGLEDLIRNIQKKYPEV